MPDLPSPRGRLRQWAWFAGLWAVSVITLALVAGLLKLVFNAIL